MKKGNLRVKTLHEGDEGYEPHYKDGCELVDIETIKVDPVMVRTCLGENAPSEINPLRIIEIAVWVMLGAFIVGFAVAIVLMITCP